MLTNDDQRDIGIYIKHFIIKICQSIISSRYNFQKFSNSSSQLSQFDWFNLTIGEHILINEQIKLLFNGNRIDLTRSLFIKIFISTNEKKDILIEKWYICMSNKQEDSHPTWKVDFYNQLAATIRSVLIVSRSNIVYRLCKAPSKYGYSISYTIEFNHEKDVDVINGFKQRIGFALCPNGSIEVYIDWKELTDLNILTTNEIITKQKIEHKDIKNEDHINDMNSHVTVAYGKSEAKINEGNKIPFDSLLNSCRSLNPIGFTIKENMNENKIDICDKKCDDTRQNSLKLNFCEASIFKNNNLLTNIKTPFAYNQCDIDSFYKLCCEAHTLKVFDEECESQQPVQLDDLLLTFNNNAHTFSNFITQLATIDI